MHGCIPAVSTPARLTSDPHAVFTHRLYTHQAVPSSCKYLVRPTTTAGSLLRPGGSSSVLEVKRQMEGTP